MSSETIMLMKVKDFNLSKMLVFCFRNWSDRNISTPRAAWGSLRSGFRTTWSLWLEFSLVLHFYRWVFCVSLPIFWTWQRVCLKLTSGASISCQHWHLVVTAGNAEQNPTASQQRAPCFLCSVAFPPLGPNVLRCSFLRSLVSASLRIWWVMSKLSKPTGDRGGKSERAPPLRLRQVNTAHKHSCPL